MGRDLTRQPFKLGGRFVAAQGLDGLLLWIARHGCQPVPSISRPAWARASAVTV